VGLDSLKERRRYAPTEFIGLQIAHEVCMESTPSGVIGSGSLEKVAQ
jgi:hypothetical protein